MVILSDIMEWKEKHQKERKAQLYTSDKENKTIHW